MKLHSQFLKLHSHYSGPAEIPVTLDELAQTLGCTHRNALHVINKMAALGWITWTPSRGRGRRSRLVFLAASENIALESMMQAISSKDISSALEGIRGHARTSSLQDTLQGWLLTYFGHHAEMHRDKRIDTLRLPVTQQMHTFDPLYMNLLAESFVSSHVFDGLIGRSGERGKFIPGLAHAWETDESRSIWTFHLRKEVLFHHGRVLTAEDVVYSFERMMSTSQRTLYSYIFKEIREVTALSATTVRILLKKPNELFLPFLCTSRAAIVPRDLQSIGEQAFGRRPAGTGPFKVVEMNEDTCVLEVFPYYFQGRAHLDRVEIIYVPWGLAPGPAETGSGGFHVIPNPQAAETASLSRIHSESSVRKFVTCNTKKKGPLSDPLLRADILSCLQEAPARPFTHTAQVPAAVLQIATIPQYAGDAEFIAGRLTQHGYSCKVVSVSPEEFKGPIRLKSDLIVFSLLRDQDEQLRLYDLYLTLSQHIEPRTRADIEGRLQMIAREPDPAVRSEGFKVIEDTLTRGYQLHILYEKPAETAYLPSVRGVTFNSQGWVDLRYLWFPPEL
ncbi:ABC transporter substrate-binding protein [Paenibacillus sp. MMS20-IR301]|uniref:ABC transporter substrate-binding protein n=1 Tax=Paenibacillus sp. MMS20-IR301 TaxID=2895946 RepID=UPI0028ED6380|nr:ABC transporter substrate-binding protein [Paenibacillus sp. MMS20-IR301]WNS45890.1 ABC transporter substrate-binding protein [Paenibacillus sp. MMS20-IR301]